MCLSLRAAQKLIKLGSKKNIMFVIKVELYQTSIPKVLLYEVEAISLNETHQKAEGSKNKFFET